MFSCNGVKWEGVVVSSPIAIYILKSKQEAGANSGGAIGSIVAQAAMADSDGIRTCKANHLPKQISQQLDPKQKHADKDAIILLRDTLSHAKSSGWWPTMTIHAGNDAFKFSTHLFSFRSIIRKMEQAGWVFNQPLAPRLKPMHDSRTAEEIANPPENTDKKFATYLAIGFCVILLIMALSAALSTFF